MGSANCFPSCDVELLYLLDGKVSEAEIKQPIRGVMSQRLRSCGMRRLSNVEKTQRGGALG